MATTGLAPIKQALAETLRGDAALTAVVPSSHINEGVEPRGTNYPYIVYSVAYAAREYDWTGMVMKVEIDILSIHTNPVDAGTIDQLVADALEDVTLSFESGSGQTSLYCRRISDLSSLDVDAAGNRIYQMGGSYRIWTDQQRTA